MIVLKTPKGWTGPKVVDGQQVEGTYRAHQVPLSAPAKNPEHLKHPRKLDAQLQAGGAVRQNGPADPRTRRAGSQGRSPDGGQSSRQRRHAAPRFAAARLLRRTRSTSRSREQSESEDTAHPRQVPARRDQAQRRPAKLPHFRPRRDGLQPPDGRVRRDQQAVGRRGHRRPTITWLPRAA